MKRINNSSLVSVICGILVFALLFLIYHKWFIYKEIIGGDWPSYFPEFLQDLPTFPTLWSFYRANGGGVSSLLNLETYQSFLVSIFMKWIGLPWNIVYKIGWFGSFIVLSVFSIYKLAKEILGNKFPLWGIFVSILIFLTNTYILMLATGGQMGVLLAISIMPLVLGNFIKQDKLLGDLEVENSTKLKISSFFAQSFSGLLFSGLLLGAQMMLDPRIAYLTIGAAFLYLILCISSTFIFIKRCMHFLGTITIAFFVNAFWLVPLIILRSNPLAQFGKIYTSVDAVAFFSFADFSHTFALLHPNWPENIFGKVYFFQPEFLVLPIIAFSSLLFLGKARLMGVSSREIVYFGLLGLAGSFFAKGINDPFGGIYSWLFSHVPGFIMFRDPSKFYIYVVVSFGILIPYVLVSLVNIFLRKLKKHDFAVTSLMLGLFFAFWIFTIREGIVGRLSGTFRERDVPDEYVELKDMLVKEPKYFRTLWVPTASRFTYVSKAHPALTADTLLSATNPQELVQKLNTQEIHDQIDALAVKYVVIPSDPLGEIFISDRKYDPEKRLEYEEKLDTISWLHKIQSGNVTIYENSLYKDHLWTEGNDEIVYSVIRPNAYRIKVYISTPSILHFSERFHNGWIFEGNELTLSSVKDIYGLNSFPLSNSGSYEAIVFFEPEQYVVWGKILTIVGISTVVLVILYLNYKRKHISI